MQYARAGSLFSGNSISRINNPTRLPHGGGVQIAPVLSAPNDSGVVSRRSAKRLQFVRVGGLLNALIAEQEFRSGKSTCRLGSDCSPNRAMR